MPMKPTLGRIVHYCNGFDVYSAIVTREFPTTDDNRVDLTVFPPGKPPFTADYVAEYSGEGGQGNTWSWPPRAPGEP